MLNSRNHQTLPGEVVEHIVYKTELGVERTMVVAIYVSIESYQLTVLRWSKFQKRLEPT